MKKEREKNEEGTKRCWHCREYFAFYTKGYIHFNREKIGYCRKDGKITENCSTCEKWSGNYIRKGMTKKFSVRVFNDTLKTLCETAQVILEDYKEREEILIQERTEKRIIKDYELKLPDND